MYLHIGNNIILKKSEIIGIFELDGKITTKETRDYLLKAQKENKLESAGFDLPKSFVVTNGENGEKIYFSHISVSSLLKRCDFSF